MTPPRSPSDPPSPALRRFFLAFTCLWCLLLVGWSNSLLVNLQSHAPPDYPFGVFPAGGPGVSAQDFSYNLLFLDGVRQHLVAHPYRMADQETLMRHMVPMGHSGMTHAYSPVALVLAQPLLMLGGDTRYLAYAILCAAATILLFGLDLLPRARGSGQLWALAICLTSVCVFLAFQVGQSVLLTTPLIGAFWVLLRKRKNPTAIAPDLLLALLFWMLCLKPSVAIIPAMLLLGARAWRPLMLGLAFLLVTWSFTARFYGGWWTGLTDYLHLLNHYSGEEMTAFMQRDHAPHRWIEQLDPHFSRHLFALDRTLVLLFSFALLGLRWLRHLDGSQHFQSMIATFLLVSPYLLPSEDWILCLLAVESSFFLEPNRLALLLKLALLAGIMNLRDGLTFPIDLNFPLRLIFFGWMLFEFRRDRTPNKEPAPLVIPV